jgi:uncharacterized protein
MQKEIWFRNSFLILLSGIGGYLFSLSGMSIGWMIGTLISAGFFGYWQPKWLGMTSDHKGIESYWRHIGQCMIGIQLGQQISASIAVTFEDNWMMITSMLLLSIAFSFLSGLFLWRFGKTDLLTSMFGTSPGGVTAMPTMAEDVGANMAVVSIVQVIRNFLVVGTIPLVAFYWSSVHTSSNVTTITGMLGTNDSIRTADSSGSLFWTLAIVVAAFAGYFGMKLINLPSPWLLGSMVGVSIIQTLGSLSVGNHTAWWPHELVILAQILIGSSIGSCFNKNRFIGAKKVVIAGVICSFGLVIVIIFCAYGTAKIMGVSFVTAVLAFAPGGVAEMATTSLALNADTNFVVAVQALRMFTVVMILPPFFRLLKYYITRRMHAPV